MHNHPNKRGKSPIKKSTTSDKSKGKQPEKSKIHGTGFGRTTRSMVTGSCKDGSGQSSSTPKSPKNKRKAPLDHFGI
ncbi:hypothetical protein J1N35_035096 [Gossypium stocksii]|uniref:Uncharacterized protein n=1 Tax=Gossypium stocksii TaxID=47602 RepID=A0A9D3UT99_9ROSI|nr:hypothetical protein J1N35_035096 [Gossypium stocksii]